MYFLVCIPILTAEELNKDKRIGFFRGIKETIGFKPYFYLLMLELFSWLGLQVSTIYSYSAVDNMVAMPVLGAS